ncbi:MAG: cytochrome c biogenesis protein CcsA [Deltaproteobacteria bacterium]|nr:cytochrome c biogenesis protein CcsA [Deltaproteobacteria bacterium]
METLSDILRIALPILYGTGAILYVSYFFKRVDHLKFAATGALVTAILAHLWYVILLGVLLGRHPMANIFEFLSFVAMTMALIYLFLQIWYRNGYIGVFIVPAVFLLQFVATLGLDSSAPLRPLLQEERFALHATAIAAAYAAYFLCMMYAVMVLLFERSIRRHRFGILFEQLPSLDVLAKMTTVTLLIGFGMMSIGLGLGALGALDAPPPVHLDTKVILTVLVWLLYGFAVVSRFVLRWSDRVCAMLSIIGFIFLVLTTVTSHVTFSSWHNFIG